MNHAKCIVMVLTSQASMGDSARPALSRGEHLERSAIHLGRECNERAR